MQHLYKFRFHLLLIFLSVIWLWIFALLTQIGDQAHIYPDSRSYHESAKNLYIFLRGHNYRPMLMAAINGIPFLFGFGDKAIYDFSFYVNVLSWIGSTLLLFAIARRFLSERNAFWVGFLHIFLVGAVALMFHLLSENIYIFFMTAGFYLLMRYYEDRRFLWLAGGVSVFVLSMLIRPGSMFLAIAISLFFIREIFRNYKQKSAWLIYGSFFLILVQCAGVKYQFGNFTISYIDAVTYYNYLGQKALDIRDGREFVQMSEARDEYIFELSMPEQKRVAAADFKDQLQHNTINLIKAYFANLAENTKTGDTALWDCKNVLGKDYFEPAKTFLFNVSKWQNRILTLIGFFAACFFVWRIREQPWFGLVGFYILYIIILSGISCSQGDRFHIVTFPFTLLLVAKLLQQRMKPDA